MPHLNAPDSLAPFQVSTPEAAQLLARPELARLLKPFMRGPKSVSEVAQAQGLSVESLHYRVQQFLKAGLLKVVEERPRRGRAVKLYQAVATDFVFASRLLKPQTIRDLQLGESWFREFIENLDHFNDLPPSATLRVKLEDSGALNWGSADPLPAGPGHPAAYFIQTGALYLNPAEAEALANELEALFHKYDGRWGRGRYGLILGLTPMTRPVD